MGRTVLRDRPDRKAAGAAGAVLSFPAFDPRHAGVHRVFDLLQRCCWRCPGSSRSIPALSLKPGSQPRCSVKNYIDQSQEFALCAVALAYPIVTLLRANRILPAVLLIALSLSFVVNMAFVIVSRTALVTMPVLLAVFALLHLRWRSIVIIVCATAVLAGLAWETSPQLRRIVGTFSRDYRLYKEQNVPDVDRPAARVLAEIAAVFCRGADVRTRHRLDAWAV